ncbi:hypothetical protein niasHT_030804 [Heterodera trifolii]|uniref:non-specific serine/threonine protein kinase n=1 Tax=Heterodera trifolii TaxID=157864 RepID=A0ABD2HXG8_9BILA
MHHNPSLSAALSNTAPLYSYTPSPHASPVAKTFAEGGGSECRALAKHSSAAYERIRTVGKGSFGIAVLYRRKDDDSFVILKEINLHELTPTERNMSLNEVALLSRLDHPHIIHYFDSFEEDGALMIEMEYADGGTLAQLLAHRDDAQPLPEDEVLDIFEQMTSAVSYLHDNNILHRDLKTANIFLTKERMVKVGDFGVSKKLSTQTNIGGGAQTMLGTPYYLSPEMCEGRLYNAKSDMWAMGCCLYEMCTLRKPFDADNLTILIHKIINCEYEPLKGPYSQYIRLIVRELFRADPEQRPSATDLLEQIRRKNPLLNSTRRVKSLAAKAAASSKRNSSQNSCYSALYRFDTEKFTLLAMSELPDRAQIKQIALSVTHQLVLTADEHVFSWGENGHGQLGHGDRRVRTGPTLIEALRGKGVSRVTAGKHFSLFCAGRGIAMAVGHRQFVGSAQADTDLLKPKIIEALLKEDIVDVCCGEEHAAVLTESGAVFVWGVGENGRLGTGETANVFVPLRIQIPTRQLINSIVCGPNATMLITNTGTVLAMGSNIHNKLNLNQRSGFFANAKKSSSSSTNGQKMSGVVDNVLTPTAVKPFPSRVVNASLGLWHSGVLLENGHVHLFGRNLAAELGHGNCQEMPAGCTCPVKALLSKACVHLVCGDGFTMAGTLDNELYSWGMHKWAAEGQQSKENGGGADQSATAAEDGTGGCSSLSSTATSLTNSDGNTATPIEQPKLKKERKSTTMRHLFCEPPQYEMSQTREGQLVRLKNGDHIMDKPKPFMMQPHLVLRLDICRKSFGSVSSPTATSSAPDPSCQLSPPSPSAHSTTSVAGSSSSTIGGVQQQQQPRLSLSALVGTHSRVFCVVDVSTEPFPPATAQSGERDKKVAENSDRSRKVAPVPKVIDIRRSSAPDPSAMAQGTATWIREELESAEVIPYRKIANSDSIHNSSALHRNLTKNAQRLREEIAALRSQLAEHKSTVRGHQSQMSQLQTKLTELESLLLRQQNSRGGLPPVNGPPPPAYSSAVSVLSPRSKSIASSGGEQRGQERQKLQSNSTTCAIL